MKIPLSELKPSPWNPKEPFTKKQLAALKRGIQKFGFQRSLCACRDFESGEGWFVLDGNTALELLKEAGAAEIDCHVVENVRDEKTLRQFMAGYSLNKRPVYSEFAEVLGKIEFPEFTGLDFGRFSFEVNIGGISGSFQEAETPEPAKPDAPAGANAALPAPEPSAFRGAERQAQYFLTLPPGCVEKLRGFVKTKAWNAGKTEAVAEKIDAMNDTQFLENILQIVL